MSTEAALTAYYAEKLLKCQRYTNGKDYLLNFWKLEATLALRSIKEKIVFGGKEKTIFFSLPIEDEWQNQIVDVWVELELEEKFFGQFNLEFICYPGSMVLYPILEERRDCEPYHDGNKTSLMRIGSCLCLGKKGYFFNCCLTRQWVPENQFRAPLVVHSVLVLVSQ